MRRLTFLVGFIFCFLGGSLWFVRSFQLSWEPLLRQKIIASAEETLHARVEIDHISLHFFYFLLEGVSVWDRKQPGKALLFHAQEISLSLSLPEIPHALLERRPSQALGVIHLVNPFFSLSPDILHRFTTHRSGKKLLWFRLSWEQGILRWKGPHSPTGGWRLSQLNGLFRIRGPKLDFVSKGALDGVPKMRVSYSAFGSRWNASAHLSDVSIPYLINLEKDIFQKPGLPEGAAFTGTVDLDAQAQGRIPLDTLHPWKYLSKARLGFENTQLQWKPNRPAIHVSGAVQMAGAQMTLDNVALQVENQTLRLSGQLRPFDPLPTLTVQTRGEKVQLADLWKLAAPTSTDPAPIEGEAQILLLLTGNLFKPFVQARLLIPSGHLYQRPFEQAVLSGRYIHDHWEFPPNQIRFWDNPVTFQGYWGRQGMDLKLTAENIPLDQLFSGQDRWIRGRLNTALSLQGTPENPRATGSFWVEQYAFANGMSQRIRGDLDYQDTHFKLRATSEDQQAHATFEGTLRWPRLQLQHGEVSFRSGALWQSTGSTDLREKTADFSLTVRHFGIPEDIPFLHEKFPALKAHVNGETTFKGAWKNPEVSGHFSSADFSLSKSNDVVPLDLTYHYADYEWVFSSKGALIGNVELRTQEVWKGKGKFAIKNLTIGDHLPADAALQWTLTNHILLIPELSYQSSGLSLHGEGRAEWPVSANENLPEQMHFMLKGNMQETKGETFSSSLFVTGILHPRDQGSGEARLVAMPMIAGLDKTDPIESQWQWNAQAFKWTHTHWGSHWTSEGQISYEKDESILSGWLDIDHLSLLRWSSFLKHKNEDPLQGTLAGRLKFEGSLAHPSLPFSGTLHAIEWRSLVMDGRFNGRWTPEGLDPLHIDATLSQGGHFSFNGHLQPRATTPLSGTLTFEKVNITPIGMSLKIPQPVSGALDGTFTVSGVLLSPSFTGHAEASSPLLYGNDPLHPLRVETLSMDAILAPRLDKPDIERLTVKQAQAKTTEEELRINPDSYIDFSIGQESEFHVGSEIRNVKAGILTLFGGLDLSGRWHLTSTGFALKGEARTRSFFINDYELEEGRLQFDYDDRVLAFKPVSLGPTLVKGSIDMRQLPQLRFNNFFILGKEGQNLQITGDIGPSRWDFSLGGEKLDLSTLAGLAGFPYPLVGTASLQVIGKGDLQHPNLSGQVDVRDGRAIFLNFDSGAASFVWQGSRMTFTRLFLADKGRYLLTGTGVFPVARKTQKVSNEPIDFSLRLENSNLGMVQSISSEIKQARGSLDGLIHITGTSDHPLFQGSIRIQNGDLTEAHYFRRLKDFNANLQFGKEQLRIVELHGRSGDGEFSGGGTVDFAGFAPRDYDLWLKIPSAQGIDVQVPELAIPESPLAKRIHFLTTMSRCNVKGNIQFKGPAENPTFAGDVTLSNGRFTFPPSQKNPPKPDFVEWMHRILWDVTLRFGDNAWFENELVSTNIVGELRLKGSSSQLRVDGGLDIVQGRFSYLGIDFDVRQARFDLRPQESEGTIVNVPYLRAIGDSQIQTVDPISGQPVDDVVNLVIDYAPLNEIKPRLTSTSDPTLTQEKVLSRLTQLDIQNLTPQERQYLYQQQMVRLLDTTLATPLARNLLKRTGLVDEVRVSHIISPTGTSTADLLNPSAAPAQTQQQATVNLLAGTKYTLSKNLSSRLSLGYGLRFETITNSELQNRLDLRSDVELSYRMLRNVYLRGSFDIPNSTPGVIPERKVTIEPQWRFGWWGHTNKPKPASVGKNPELDK